MSNNEIPKKRWDRLKGELLAYRQSEAEIWGGIDDGLLARYIVGQCNDEELAEVEKAAGTFPAVREAIEVLRDVLGVQKTDTAKRIDTSTQSIAGIGVNQATVVDAGTSTRLRSFGRGSRWLPASIAMTVACALVVVIILQRIEIQRLVEQNNKARNQTSQGFELQWTTGETNGSVDWKTLLNEHYDPKLPAAEILNRLERVGGDRVRKKIAELRTQKPSPKAEKILKDLFDLWGAPPKRAEGSQ